MSKLELVHELSPTGVCTIHAKGVLDAHTASDLDTLIAGIVKNGCSRIVCVLAHVTYIASAGVGVFVGFVNSLQAKGGDLILVHPVGFEGDAPHGSALQEGYNALEVFNLLGLAEFIKVEKTAEAAYTRFK